MGYSICPTLMAVLQIQSKWPSTATTRHNKTDIMVYSWGEQKESAD